MKHINKIISAVSTALTAAVISASALPVNGAFEKTENKDYDLYYSYSYNYYDYEYAEPIQKLKTCYIDVYLKFETPFSGIYYEYGRDYKYVFITVYKDADTKELNRLLGPDMDISDVYFYTLGEDQLVFKYSENVDYESLYKIDGVKKVELAKTLYANEFYKEVPVFEKEWEFLEDSDENTIASIVKTEEGIELTPEMFADTGFTVKHIYNSNPGEWFVYYDYSGIESYTEFDKNAKNIEGVISSDVIIGFLESAAETTLKADTVEPAGKLRGDANLDGKINIHDVIKVAESLIGKTKLTSEETETADYNRDGKVNIHDAIGIAEYILKNK